MEKNELLNNQKYLTRFYQILSQMEYKMINVLPYENITAYFIKCMIPHHQAAIYMCYNLLFYSKYSPLIEIANNIIQTQKKGIKQMKRILKTTKDYDNSYYNLNSYYQNYFNITKKMVYEMGNNPFLLSVNLNFINEMIPHHEGAIYMCYNLLNYNIDPRLKEFAYNIIQEQSLGVKQLKYLRAYLYDIKNVN